MQTFSLGPSPTKARSEADVVAHLAVRLATLTAQLEEVIFERDLAQRAHARLAEEYRVLAQQQATLPDLRQKLELTLRERAQLEHEAQLLRQQCERLQTDNAHWRAAHDCLAEQQQQLLQEIANLSADTQSLHSYAVSQRQFLTVVQRSRRWRFGQAVAGWFGRRWQ